jgi:hypothetical protein
MSFFPDITPLKEEIKKFNENQHQIIDLLRKNHLVLEQIKELLIKK